jgi:hypothetical protein
VRPEFRLGIGFFGVTASRIEHFAFADRLTPGRRVIAILTPYITFFVQAKEDVDI